MIDRNSKARESSRFWKSVYHNTRIHALLYTFRGSFAYIISFDVNNWVGGGKGISSEREREVQTFEGSLSPYKSKSWRVLRSFHCLWLDPNQVRGSSQRRNISHYLPVMDALVSFQMAQVVKNPLAKQEMQETSVPSLGLEDPLEEDMATCSSILVGKIAWIEEPGRLLSMGSQMSQTLLSLSLSLSLSHTHTQTHRHTHRHTHTVHPMLKFFTGWIKSLFSPYYRCKGTLRWQNLSPTLPKGTLMPRKAKHLIARIQG